MPNRVVAIAYANERKGTGGFNDSVHRDIMDTIMMARSHSVPIEVKAIPNHFPAEYNFIY